MTTGTRGPTPRVVTKVKKRMEMKLRATDRSVQDMERIRLNQFGTVLSSRWVESRSIKGVSEGTAGWRISELEKVSWKNKYLEQGILNFLQLLLSFSCFVISFIILKIVHKKIPKNWFIDLTYLQSVLLFPITSGVPLSLLFHPLA